MNQQYLDTKFRDFRPDRNYLIKNSIYVIIFSLIFIFPILGLSWLLEEWLLSLIIPVIIGFFLILVKLYYDSLHYTITNTEIVIKLGIFFKKEVIIPIRTITNIDTFKGPVDRMFGIASVNIQTAGRASIIAEGRFVGLLTQDAQQLTNLLKLMLQKMQGGDGTTMEGTTSTSSVDLVLAELRAIKNVLLEIRDANAK